MIYSITNNLIIEKVKINDNHIKILYEILKKRKKNYKISYKDLPTFKKHQLFVKKNPYRVWFLVFKSKECIGTIYLSKMNEVGIYLSKNEGLSEDLIEFVTKKYRPLKGKYSVRSEKFIINISPKNVILRKLIEKMGAKLIQNTYLFD